MAISGIALTSKNYDVAITLLKQKFGRPDAIIEMLLKHLCFFLLFTIYIPYEQKFWREKYLVF